MSKILVAYFSASPKGVTREKAKNIADACGADLYEIKPEVPYTEADLEYRNKDSRSTIEMKDKTYRPPIADTDAHVENYDLIFLGFPIWWYTAPTVVNTWLEKNDFSGKTIVLFATSDGTKFGKSLADISASVSSDCTVKEGKLLTNMQPIVIARWTKEVIEGK